MTSISVDKSFQNFAQSTAVTLPCSLQNFMRIAQSWKYLCGNEIQTFRFWMFFMDLLYCDTFQQSSLLELSLYVVQAITHVQMTESLGRKFWQLAIIWNVCWFIMDEATQHNIQWNLLYALLEQSWKGGILVSRHPSVPLSVCPSVCPSICGQNCVCSVSSAILAGSILYLHILSGNFRWCVTCNVFSKILKLVFLQIYWICKFVLFWLGIWYESTIWVIMGYRRVFSKCRHSNCCSWSILMFRFS